MTKPLRTRQFLALLLFCVSEVSLADPLWRDFSGSYVAGSGFTLPDQQQTVTFQNGCCGNLDVVREPVRVAMMLRHQPSRRYECFNLIMKRTV